MECHKYFFSSPECSLFEYRSSIIVIPIEVSHNESNFRYRLKNLRPNQARMIGILCADVQLRTQEIVRRRSVHETELFHLLKIFEYDRRPKTIKRREFWLSWIPTFRLELNLKDFVTKKIRDEKFEFRRIKNLLIFLSQSTVDLMNELESIFSFCSPNEDGDFQKLENEFYELTTSALFSWTLLLTTLPVNESHNFVRKFAPKKICELLDSPNADFRNQAAETVAILYEIGFEIQSVKILNFPRKLSGRIRFSFQVFAEPPELLLTKLEQKSKESTKSKSKKEKRLQHATFREIFNWFEVKESPSRNSLLIFELLDLLRFF